MMDLLEFCRLFAHGVVSFLLTEPIFYFTGVLILVSVAYLVKRIIR